MDDAARRVAPGDLRAMVRHRQERERAALADMQAALSAAAEAEAALGRAERECAARETDRDAGERTIYDRLGCGDPLSPSQLEKELVALTRLTEVVDEAQRGVEDARRRLLEALRKVEARRAHYVLRARDAAKWVRIDETAAHSRRQEGERIEELELEDEIGLRYGAVGSGAGA